MEIAILFALILLSGLFAMSELALVSRTNDKVLASRMPPETIVSESGKSSLL